MQETYFKGDIVEIITATYGNWNEIPIEERGYYECQNEPAPIRGQRFRVHQVSDGRMWASIKGKTCLHVDSDCVILVKRSFVNWLRYFISQFK